LELKKQEIIEIIAEEFGIPNYKMKEILDKYIVYIKSIVKSGGRVSIRNFGTFKTKTLEEKVSVTPVRPEKKIIPRRIYPVFCPSKSFKTEVCQKRTNQNQ